MYIRRKIRDIRSDGSMRMGFGYTAARRVGLTFDKLDGGRKRKAKWAKFRKEQNDLWLPKTPKELRHYLTAYPHQQDQAIVYLKFGWSTRQILYQLKFGQLTPK